jgi:hypothetical protein
MKEEKYIYQRWYIYRKLYKDGSNTEIRLDHRMMFGWLRGWKLISVVEYELNEED